MSKDDPRTSVMAYVGIEWDGDGNETKFISIHRATREQLQETERRLRDQARNLNSQADSLLFYRNRKFGLK